jgi:hypothetical protein
MNLTVIFAALFVLAIFVVPFYWVAHSKKHPADQPDQEHQQPEKENSQVLTARAHGKKH